MAEALRTLNADLLAIRGALEAGSPAGTPAAALREKLAQEFLAVVHGFHARFAQCRRMRAGGPAPGGLRGPRLLGLHRLHPGADALSLGGRAVVPGLAPQGRWLRENPHLLLPAGIVFLVTYARRGSRPGEPAGHTEALLRGIAAHFRPRGAPADELVQFLKDDFSQLMGQYPGYLAQCQAMSQIPPACFPGRARELLAGLGPAEGVLAGTVPDGVVSMRPCLWEVGAGEAQAGEKLHTYFTRLDGALDAKQLLEEIWGHPRCINSPPGLAGQPGDPAGGLPVPGHIPEGLPPGRALSEGADPVPLPSPERVWLGSPDPRPAPLPGANRKQGPWRTRTALCHARDERETEAACCFPPPTAGTSATKAATACSH
ncbi:uncharacterized protein LOC119566299 [Chelonia mydas]|uniref:uncharacterized protein LOC119566299 n=1 Tax=Chelonia mydas TaxID=8469 RepID=UPI0018A1C79E|nr:uncharacterized protein LOC119566299 [Chelonia mydas]